MKIVGDKPSSEFKTHSLVPIFRSRSLFSTFKYHLLKKFSNSWKEVSIQAQGISEKILIKKCDEEYISNVGLITGN